MHRAYIIIISWYSIAVCSHNFGKMLCNFTYICTQKNAKAMYICSTKFIQIAMTNLCPDHATVWCKMYSQVDQPILTLLWTTVQISSFLNIKQAYRSEKLLQLGWLITMTNLIMAALTKDKYSFGNLSP